MYGVHDKGSKFSQSTNRLHQSVDKFRPEGMCNLSSIFVSTRKLVKSKKVQEFIE